MRKPIAAELQAAPPGTFYTFTAADIGRRMTGKGGWGDGPVRPHNVGRRCTIIDGELHIERQREYRERIDRETATNH